MKISILHNSQEAGLQAAAHGAELLRQALKKQDTVSLVVATGTSQFATLSALITEPGIAWNRVVIFHLDEYIGISIDHPASFRRYLWDRFHRRLTIPPKAFHYIDGTVDPVKECQRLSALIGEQPVSVCFAGIGENGHLAFNDPPADFDNDQPYLIVNLDEACRLQQLGEGWFPSLDAVPQRAISMSIRQILKAQSLILTVSEKRKAAAVQKSTEGPITPEVPASIIQRHPHVSLFLDPPAASLLKVPPA